MKLLLSAFLFSTICFSNSQELSKKILFVGNSLTYTNNLPLLVQKAASKKGVNLEVTMIAYPNYAIIDHLNDGHIQKELAASNYDVVIVQQGPSSQNEGRQMLFDDGAKLKALCDEYGAQMAYFMVWPSVAYQFTFERVIKNHQEASFYNDALLLPVGSAWKKYIAKTGKTDYYGQDGFHPSLKGSKAAAEIIVGSLITHFHSEEAYKKSR